MEFLKKNAPSLIAGAFSGFINGLLGAGGGIIATFYLSKKLDTDNKNDIFANAVATMLPISIFSFALYSALGHFTPNASLFRIAPTAFAGGLAGAFLLTKLKFKVTKKIFALLVTVSGFMMIFR